MRASIYTRYGPPEVLRLAEVEKPTPAADEVLIRVHATSVNYGDLLARKFAHVGLDEFNMPAPLWVPARLSFGWRRPRNHILGNELAGVIEAVGEDVTSFQVGEEVFGYRGQRMGAYAEYVCLAEDGELARKPSNMSFEEAAVVPYGGITAMSLLQQVELGPATKIMVIGASGSIGSAAVQLAKHAGAAVTGVCGTPRKEFVSSLGADHVIDYMREDLYARGDRYDVIFDILGSSSFSDCKASLQPDGRYLMASFKLADLGQMLWTSIRGGKRVTCSLAPAHTGNLPRLKELIEAGAFKANIDRVFPLAQTAQAHRYVEQGKKRGHIAVKVAPLS